MAAATSRDSSQNRRRARPLRWLAIAALSLVGLALVLVLAVFAFVATPAGGERVRELVVEKANAAVEGALAVRKLSLRGGHLVLEGLELRDPDGDVVASVAALEVRLRLAALLRKRIDVELVRLDRPEIHFEEDESGSNLQRALAERNPTPKHEEESKKSSLGIVVEDIEIAGGALDVVQRTADSSRRVHLDDLGARGSAMMVGDALGARLTARGTWTAPFEGPLRLSLDASGAGPRKEGRLVVALGTAKLVAAAHMDDERHADVRIESLVVPPELAHAFAPAYPLRAVASLSGEARRSGDELSIRLDARAASSTARVEGDFDLATRRSRRATLTLRHVDLSELTDEGPASDVALTFVASGGGASFDDLAGRLELSVPSSAMAGETMGPVHVVASASGGELQVAELVVNVPGLRIEARGRASRERLALGGTLVAKDLAAFSRTLGKLAGGPRSLSVKGHGRLDVAVAGSAEHPAVKADASFPMLTYQQTRVEGLALHLDAPDLKRLRGTHARATARTLALAPGKVFRAAHVAVDGSGRDLGLDAAIHGYADLRLRAKATLSPGGHAATLNALSLRYPEARWDLQAPVRIESRPGRLALSPLTLRSGAQAISASVLRQGPTLDASLDVRSLDLGKLPRAFVDPSLALSGILSVQAQATGRAMKPDVTARLELQRGRFKRYRDVQLRLDVSYAGEVARGSLDASGSGVRIAGSFDVPVKALKLGRRVPVKVDLHVPELRLDESLRDLGVEKPISGIVSAQVSVRGTAEDPRLRLAFRGRRLRVKQVAPSDVDLVLASSDDGRLGARVGLVMEGRKSFLDVKTPFRLGELLRRPLRPAALASAAFALDAELRELPLNLLFQAGVSSRPLEGAVSARAHVDGTPMSPRGDVSVDVKGLSTKGLRPLDASVRLRAGDELRADVRVEQGGKSVFTARARVAAGAKGLADPSRVAQVPLSVEADLGPLSLSDLQAATQQTDVDPAQAPPRIRGTLASRLSVNGTLHDPRVELRTRVEGLGTEGTPVGLVSVSFDYRDAKETVDLLLKSQNKGELHAAAAAHLDLSYPAAARARLEAAPVAGTLAANDFDPAFLSNVGGAVEKLGGLFYADARVSGTMGSPNVKGRLEWKDGVVFTHGSGDFTNIHLLATGDNDRLELKELTAKSGGGTAKLSALAARAGKEKFKLHVEADVNKLPVMSQGQVTATLSVRSTADGDVSPTKVSVKKLDIPEAHVQLPDVQRKDLQKLDDPPDVVLTLNGEPVRGSKSKPPGNERAGGEPEAAGSGSGDAEAPASGRAGMQIAALVNAPRNLWIQGNDVNAEIGLSEGFRVEYAGAPRVFGDVNVLRGRLDVFGRRFDLQRDSKISFTGPPMRPDLNVMAAYKNEMEQVTVYLKVQGQAQRLKLQPTSEPPLAETEIYTLLATGHTSLHHGSGASSPSGQAASLVGSVAASQLKKTLSSNLPLDVLSIEAGDSGIAGSKLEAGTYVNDRFYVGFTGRIGADPMRGENSNEVDLEYQLSKHWSLNGSYGDARAGGAGATWRTDY